MMTKQSAIAARDHGAGVPQQGFDRMAGRRCLPCITVEVAGLENCLSDFLLGRVIAKAVKGAKHALRPCPLLGRYSGIGRDSAAMDCGEQAMQGFESIEPFKVERNDCRDRRRAGREQLKLLAIGKPNYGMDALLVDLLFPTRKQRRIVICVDEKRWRGRQDNDAGVVLRQPENGGRRMIEKWIYREIATSSADGFFPSTRLCPLPSRTRPRNPDCTPHCDEAIPMRDPNRSTSRHDRSKPRNATVTHRASLRSPIISIDYGGL